MLGACTQFPELDAHVSPAAEKADFPKLVPLEPLLAARTGGENPGPEIAQNLSSRVAALRARANRLRGSVLSPPERARLRQRPGT